MRGLWTVPLLLAFAPQALAQDAPPRARGMLGSEWVEGGQSRQARVVFGLAPDDAPDPALYRRAEYDWKSSTLDSGWYPRPAFAAKQEGTVRVRVTVGADGKPTACAITRGSGVAALDAHSCPHVMAHTRYFPALDTSGARRGDLVEASLRYELKYYMIGGAPGGNRPDPPRARPVAPITLATIGLTPAARPAEVHGFSVRVAVDKEGKVRACELFVPTQVDALDKQICDRMMAVPFTPARNASGAAVESLYSTYVSFGG